MIGLVNATGSPEASRAQSIADAGFKHGGGKKRTDQIPLPSNEQAVEKVLDSAVEGIEFLGASEERELPGGDTSDRFAQADAEAGLPSTLGSVLDVQA